jgi:hypothetical protein
MKNILYILIILSFAFNANGQSFYFGPKGGIGINVQQWNSFQRDPLFSPFGDIFIESYTEDSPSSLYAQLGYHIRGSALRLQGFSGSFSNAFKFNNLVFVAGAKRIISMDKKMRPYYIVGIRAEYNLGTNLDDFSAQQSLFYPLDFYVNRFVYGFTAGGGFDFDIGELYGGFIEFAVNPDLARQYDQPSIPNVISPYDGRSITIPNREIKNLSLEITFGFRFLRKVEYY